jgi:hypothetical protein
MSSKSRHNSNNQNDIDIQYVKKEQMHKIKHTLMEKILRDIKNKYQSILEDKKLKLNDFYDKIFNEIDIVYNSKDWDYSKLLRKIENYILKQLSKYDDSKRENLMEKKEVEVLIERTKPVYETNQQFLLGYLPEGKIKRNKLRWALRKREEDGCAKIIKNDKKKFEEEEHNRIKEHIFKKNTYKKELDQLVNTKKQDEKFVKNHNSDIFFFPDDSSIKMQNKKIYEQINLDNKKNVELLRETSEFYNKIDQELENERIQKSIQEDGRYEENLKKKKLYELDLQNYLRKQIEDKKEAKITNESLKKDEKNKMIELLKNESKQKLNYALSIKNLKSSYKKELDEQIKLKKEIPSMSHTEELINKKLLYS